MEQGAFQPGGPGNYERQFNAPQYQTQGPTPGGYQRQPPPAYGGPAQGGPDFAQLLQMLQGFGQQGGAQSGSFRGDNVNIESSAPRPPPRPFVPGQAPGNYLPGSGSPGGGMGGGMGPMGSGMSPQLMQMFQMFQNPQMANFFRQIFGGGQMGGPMQGPGSLANDNFNREMGPGSGGMMRPNTAPSTLPGTMYQGANPGYSANGYPTGGPAQQAPQPPQAPQTAGGVRGLGGSWMNSLFPGGGPSQTAGGSPVTSMGNAGNISFTPR